MSSETGSAQSMGIGVGLTPFETRSDVVVRIAQLADERGLDFVGVAEGWTYDSLIVLAEIALRTSRIRLGSIVLNVLGRTPATIALGAAGLQRCSDGRFTLGVGAGSPALAEGFHGVAWSGAVARTRETVVAVRALLDGERFPSPVNGTRALRLGALPDVPLPIALAALSPSSIRLAGELAEDWVPFLWARSQLDSGRGLLASGEARATSATSTRVCPAVPVALASTEDGARALAAWWLATYATRMGPLYPRMLSKRFGFGSELNAVVEASADGASPTLPAAADALANEVTMMGTYDGAGAAIAAWFQAGADAVNLTLPPGRPEAELIEIVETAAEVRRSITAAPR